MLPPKTASPARRVIQSRVSVGCTTGSSMLSLKQAHANSDLDRNPHRLDHRRVHPGALGRRSVVLFGAAAERRRRFCRAVGRIQDVDVTKGLPAANGGGPARLSPTAPVESRHATALNVIKVSKRLSQ